MVFVVLGVVRWRAALASLRVKAVEVLALVLGLALALDLEVLLGPRLGLLMGLGLISMWAVGNSDGNTSQSTAKTLAAPPPPLLPLAPAPAPVSKFCRGT